MYKLTIELLKAEVRDIDIELIDIAINGGNAFKLIDLKTDILKSINHLNKR